MADIQIAITAKNEASAAINQTSADLTGLANVATTTNATLSGLGNISQGLTGAGATIQAVTADLSQLSAAARESGQSIASSIRGPDTSGITNITAAIGTLHGELATLKTDAAGVLAKGVLGDGTASSAAVARISNQVSLLNGDLTSLRAAATSASNAGILGDAAGPKAALEGVSATVARLRDELTTITSGATGISVKVNTTDTAIPVLKQVQAELVSTAQQAVTTNTALSGIGGTMASISTATTSLQTLATQMRDVAAQAQTTNKTLSEPIRVQNAAGAEAISLGIKAARAEVTGLFKDLEGLAKVGKLDFGEGSTAALVTVRTELGKQLAAIDQVSKASQTAAKSGLLGDGASAAQQLARVTQSTQALRSGLQGVAQQAKASLASVKGDLSGLNTTVGNLGSILGGGGAGAIAGALGLGAAAVGISQITGAINDAVAAGDRLGKLRGAFDQLASAAGQSGEEMLNSLRAASSGMVSDADLILSANKAMLLGVADTSEELGSLLNIARTRGQAMGLDLATAFDQITIGIGRLSPRILDNLGIIVDEEAAYAKLAETLKKNADQLTENEKRQALLNAITKEGQGLVAKPPTGAGAAVAQSKAAGANAQAEAGTFFAPTVRDINQAYLDFLELVQGKLDKVAQASREVNDIVADGGISGISGTFVKLDETQITRFQDLAVALAKANTAFAAGVPDAEKYRDVLAEDFEKAKFAGGISAQLAGAIEQEARAVDVAAAAHQKKAAAMQAAQAAASSASPYFSQIAEQEELVATNSFRASDEMVKLAGSLGVVGAAALAQASNLDEFNAAVNRIQGGFAAADRVQAVRQAAIGKAQSEAQRAVNAGADPKVVAEGLAQVTDRIFNMAGPTEQTAATMFLFKQNTEGATVELGATADGLEEANATAKQFAQDGLQQVKQQFDDIRGKVASVIGDAQNLPSFKAGDLFNADELKSKNLSFDAQINIDQAANGGIAPDAINENAKRLMAIAKEGFKDQSWLDEFKREVPDVFKELSESPDIRGSALHILQEFQNGLRPELLDKGLIKDRVKALIIGDQNAAALADEIAQEIAQEMGISLQKAMSATSSALGLGTGDAAGAGAADVTAPDLTAAGTTTGESFRAGVVAGFNATGMTGLIVAKIDAEFSNPKNIDTLKKSGGTVGAVWGTGFMATVGDNVPPGLLDMLTTKLLPAILAAIGTASTRTGATP